MLKSLVGAIAVLLTTGCVNVAYYAQAVEGHLRVMAVARPIPDLIANPGTDAKLRSQLEHVFAIREFASTDLALPKNGSYRSYAALGRPFVVWNVFAAPEFSVEPQQWCLLLVGCVSYRGYYDQEAAQRFAGELGQHGVETYVAGIPAYSTLGFFDDPVLNTFLRLGEQEVARIVFHELAHQVVYAKDDSAFNESFATAVENEGMHRWLGQTATVDRLRDFETQQRRKGQFLALVADCRARLRTLYALPLAVDEMRLAKSGVMEETLLAYADLKKSWGGYAGYDRWFSQPLNNAAVSSLALYTQWVPAFRVLLDRERGNLPDFYLRVAELAKLSKIDREAALRKLLPDDPAVVAKLESAAQK